MNTEEVSNTGDGGVDNQQNLQERSINMVQGEGEGDQCEMPTIKSIEADLKIHLSDVLKDLDKDKQLVVQKWHMSLFDKVTYKKIKEMEDDEAAIEKEKEELLGFKDVAPPAKYDELSQKLLELKDLVMKRKKEFSQKSLGLRNLITTLYEQSMQKEDEKQESVEKLVGEKITAVEENME